MKVNFNINFKDVFGNEIAENNVGTTIAQILFCYGGDTHVPREDKFKAWILSQKIVQSSESVELSTEEATLIKTACEKALNAGGFGQVYELIESCNNMNLKK